MKPLNRIIEIKNEVDQLDLKMKAIHALVSEALSNTETAELTLAWKTKTESDDDQTAAFQHWLDEGGSPHSRSIPRIFIHSTSPTQLIQKNNSTFETILSNTEIVFVLGALMKVKRKLRSELVREFKHLTTNTKINL